jgi:hypothetical protein
MIPPWFEARRVHPHGSMWRSSIDKQALLSICCAIVSVHALGPILPPSGPHYAMTGAFAALSGLFALSGLLRKVSELPRPRSVCEL